MAQIHVKRIYDQPTDSDGARILIDRLWPRGVSKDGAKLTAWFKELAPSDELRQWYDHDPQRFERFADAYRRELEDKADALDRLRDTVDLRRRITLLTATRDVQYSHAPVLRAWLQEHV